MVYVFENYVLFIIMFNILLNLMLIIIIIFFVNKLWLKKKLIIKRLKNVWVMLVKYWNWKKFIIKFYIVK